jgi:hypothetical protein
MRADSMSFTQAFLGFGSPSGGQTLRLISLLVTFVLG